MLSYIYDDFFISNIFVWYRPTCLYWSVFRDVDLIVISLRLRMNQI